MTKDSPGVRCALGGALLAAAPAIDTTLVKDRLARFARAHDRYVEAQGGVRAADAAFRAACARLAECRAIHDDAVAALARALVGDGLPRRNPFAAFRAPAPSDLVRLPSRRQLAAVRRLVAAVARRKDANASTMQAAQTAGEAAVAIEQAVAVVASQRQDARDARRTRDAVAPGWESALAALRHAARAAADDGAGDLYPALFGAAAARVTARR
jgi:hypothetical protein